MAHACYDKLRKCAHCGKQFRASRSDAQTCSPKCRQARKRKPKIDATMKIRQGYEDAHGAIVSISMFAGDYGFEGYRAKQALKAIILEAANLLDAQTREQIVQQIRPKFSEL